MITIVESSPTGDAAVALTDALSVRLAALTGDEGRSNYRPETLGSRGCFLLAMDGDTAVGCGALRPLEGGARDDVGEIKRMYARQPGAGIGSALLRALEERARLSGFRSIVLETRRVNALALAFYVRHGYAITQNYGPYVGRSDAVCLSKSLATDAATGTEVLAIRGSPGSNQPP